MRRDLGTAGQGVSSPVPVDTFDAVIVGAGAAGLSLACHLAHAGWGRNVLLVDDGSRPLADRSWAWWTTGGGLLDADAVTAVGQLLVSGPGWRRQLELAPYSYRRITGTALREASDRLLGTHPGYRHLRGAVRSITREKGGARVSIDVSDSGGRSTLEVRAQWVFDSVGPGSTQPDSASSPHLDFLGLHVECATDTFDREVATLMDFRTDQSTGVAFLYVLPTSARTALVERTVFVHPGGPDRPAAALNHEVHVAEYLRTHLGVDLHRVTSREVGTIPLLGNPPAQPLGPVIPIGARAGMVKASTGYAFERIQRHSAAIAAQLTRGRSPARAAVASRWHRALDGALLRVIRDDPDAALDVFTTLFIRNRPDAVLAFLDQDAPLRRQLQLFSTLPLAPFARAQLHAAVGRPPRRERVRQRGPYTRPRGDVLVSDRE